MHVRKCKNRISEYMPRFPRAIEKRRKGGGKEGE
jgi:hypothetical protein